MLASTRQHAHKVASPHQKATVATLRVVRPFAATYTLSMSLPTLIGRSSSSKQRDTDCNFIGFDDSFLSRRHALITPLPARNSVAKDADCLHGKSKASYLIADLGSSNGTYVNGQLLRPNEAAAMKDGDFVQFGVDDDDGSAIVVEVCIAACKDGQVSSSIAGIDSSHEELVGEDELKRIIRVYEWIIVLLCVFIYCLLK